MVKPKHSLALLFLLNNVASTEILAHPFRTDQFVFSVPTPANLYSLATGRLFAQCECFHLLENTKLLCKPLFEVVNIPFVIETANDSVSLTNIQTLNCLITANQSSLILGCSEASSASLASSDSKPVASRKPNFRTGSSSGSNSQLITYKNQELVAIDFTKTIESLLKNQTKTEKQDFDIYSLPRLLINWENTKKSLDVPGIFGHSFYFDDMLENVALNRMAERIEMPATFEKTLLSNTSYKNSGTGKMFICQVVETPRSKGSRRHVQTDMRIMCFSISSEDTIMVTQLKFRYYPFWFADEFSFWCKLRLTTPIQDKKMVIAECISFEIHGVLSYNQALQARFTAMPNYYQDVADARKKVIDSDPDFLEMLSILANDNISGSDNEVLPPTIKKVRIGER